MKMALNPNFHNLVNPSRCVQQLWVHNRW